MRDQYYENKNLYQYYENKNLVMEKILNIHISQIEEASDLVCEYYHKTAHCVILTLKNNAIMLYNCSFENDENIANTYVYT